MSMRKSAGTILYRHGALGYEVLIVHPSGKANINAAWSFPKGTIEVNESPEDAARRETLEECNIIAPPKLVDLGDVTYASKKKKVYGFAGEISFTIQPTIQPDEIDKAEFFPLDKAKTLLHVDQARFIDRLQKHLGV